MAAYDITALSSVLEFDTGNGQSLCIDNVPSTDWVIVSWKGSTNTNVQTFAVNPATGAITANGSALAVDTSGSTNGTRVIPINASNAIVIWHAGTDNIYARLVSINGSGICTTNGAIVTISDVANTLGYPGAVLVDSTHVFIAWSNLNAVSRIARVYSFDTALGTMAASGAGDVTISSGLDVLIGSEVLLNSTHIMCGGSTNAASTGYVQVVSLDGSYNVAVIAGSQIPATTLLGTILTNYFSLGALDLSSNPMKVACLYGEFAGRITRMKTFTVDTSTWKIGSTGNVFTLPIGNVGSNNEWNTGKNTALLSGGVLVGFATGTNDDGYAVACSLPPDYSNIQYISQLEYDTDISNWATCIAFSSNWFVGAWAGTSADGFIQAFSVTLPSGGEATSINQAIDTQTFTANGTWTKPHGAKTIKVVTIGAGGGGGGGSAAAAGSGRRGGCGGGAGAYSEKVFNSANIANSVAITIGGGGQGGSTNNSIGNIGGNSSFGTYLGKSVV